MKCVLCNQRKAKRSCPAKDAFICPQCCGEKRILEIDCPETCSYLQVGRTRELSQLKERHYRTSDPVKKVKYQRVLTQFYQFFNHVEFFLGEERRASRNLMDKDVCAALDLVLDTLRTEEKGIFYDRVSSNLNVDALRRQLQEIVKYHRSSPEEKLGDGRIVSELPRQSMKLVDIIDSLEVIRDEVASYMEGDSASQNYVNFLGRLVPRKKRVSDSGSGLIVPGR